jgi:membrane protease YdiL (CAAX protease family)
MDATVALPLEHPSHFKPLKPMGLLESIPLFGIPAIALALAMLWLCPTLVAGGLPGDAAYTISLTLVNLGLLIAAVTGYLLEGNPLNWSTFAQRMRLTRLTGRTWIWTLLGTVFLILLSGLIILPATAIYQALHFQSPETVWEIPFGMTIINLFFNIVGEELWWRGYILPRQELAFGKKTFLLHGVMWTCFHMYRWYSVPFMFLTQWVIPFIVQRTKNTWPGMISHFLLNGTGILVSSL